MVRESYAPHSAFGRLFSRGRNSKLALQKRSEAASEIIGKFRICSQELVYWINARCSTPRDGEDAAERKIHVSIKKYVESCLEPSAQFSIPTRKILDKHFEKMKILANIFSGAVRTDTSSGIHTSSEKAGTILDSVNSPLAKEQDLLDQTLGPFLER